MTDIFIYKGEKLKKPKDINGKVIQSYLPDKNLIDAVNLAIYLKRPLLVMGDPGCGKTRLAEAIAYELYEDRYEDYLFQWHIKSTTKAKEGIYKYDALERFRDSQMKEETTDTIKTIEKGKETIRKIPKEKYILKGELGKAIENSTKEKRTILLIDEIDKADIDFPNDLLLELDNSKFKIEERDEIITANYPPIIIITSNNEKELPAAFLRRCIFHYIEFPDEKLLSDIILSNYKHPQNDNKTPLDEEKYKLLVDTSVKVFSNLRNEIEQIIASTDKNISTSELLDWFKIIYLYYDRKTNINIDNISEDILSLLQKALEKLENNEATQIPFYQVLLKNWDTYTKIMSNL